MFNFGVHDREYYFDDGNVILLVEDTLFKIHTSRLIPQSPVFRDMFQLPRAIGDALPNQLEGGSDDNPIIIPQVSASAFRHLLLLLYGMITDKPYQRLIAEVADDSQRTTSAFKSYLDIASLAHRFGMSKIEEWALKQFRRVLASPLHLSGLLWGQTELLEALAYAKLQDGRVMERQIRNLVGCHLQKTRSGLAGRFRPIAYIGTHENLLVDLYNNIKLKDVDPALFGLVFCAVLSEGHESSVWAQLALDDRAKLLAAQVYLTPLPFSCLDLGWVKTPVKILNKVKKEDRSPCFTTCSNTFTRTIFPTPFDPSYLARLHADSPLVGIVALREIPELRRRVAKQLDSVESWVCKEHCGRHILYALDETIESVFSVLSGSYHGRIR